MKSFTQRWREASDEAEDQPMEDTPTDPKEAHIPVPCSTSSIWPLTDAVYLENVKWNLDRPEDKDRSAVVSHMLNRPKSMREHAMELESALAEQTERADRLQELMEESAKESESMRQTAMHLSEQRDRLQAEVEALNGKLTAAILGNAAELDAVRKERDRARGYHHHLCQEHLGSGQCTCWIISVGAKHAGEYDTEVRKLQAKCAELEKLIQDAPHEAGCHAGLYAGPRAIRLTCTCWKSRLTPAPPEEKRP